MTSDDQLLLRLAGAKDPALLSRSHEGSLGNLIRSGLVRTQGINRSPHLTNKGSLRAKQLEREAAAKANGPAGSVTREWLSSPKPKSRSGGARGRHRIAASGTPLNFDTWLLTMGWPDKTALTPTQLANMQMLHDRTMSPDEADELEEYRQERFEPVA